MSAAAEQLAIAIPMQVQQQHQQEITETLTFKNELSRDSYVIQQRAYGYDVFMSYQGVNRAGAEIYSIIRRKLS